MATKKIHRHCGGKIENNKCTKCGQKWGKFSKLLGVGPSEVEVFDEDEYRQRIRERRDIPK